MSSKNTRKLVIGVSDPDGYTFSQQLINHWKSQGHDVVQSLYHEESFVDTCDVVWYDFASQAVVELAKFGKKPKKCIVRAIDIENYMGYWTDFNWDLIDYMVFLNKAQWQMMKSDSNWLCPDSKVRIIPPGVPPIYTPRQPAFEIKEHKAVYVGRMWIGKNVAGAIEVVEELNKKEPWSLYIRGEGLDPVWWKKYVEHRIEQAKFPIYIDGRVDNMNEYLQDKDVLILPSYKEAFSYVMAEALAKKIRVVTNNWYGADTVWPQEVIYTTPSEAVKKIYQDFGAINFPDYSEEAMFARIDELL